MADVSFSVVARDFASRTLRGIGRSALEMAAMVNAANSSMADGWERNTQMSRGWFNAIIYGAPLIPPLIGTVISAVGALNSIIMSATPGIGALGGALFLLGKDYMTTSQNLATAKKSVDNTKPGTDAHKQAVANYNDLKRQSEKGQYGQGYKEFEKTKGAIADFNKANQVTTIPISMTAFKILQDLLPKLTPLVKTFGDVFNNALKRVDEGVNSPGFAKFLTWAQQVGAVNFNNILSAIGNLIVTLGNLGVAFSDQGTTMSQWLANTTAKWKEWSSTLSTNKGFQDFLQYMKENGPLLGQTLKNLAKFLTDFVEALGPLGHFELVGLKNLSDILANIPENVMNVVATGIMATYTAAKLFTTFAVVYKGAAKIYVAWAGFMAAAQGGFRDSLIATRIGLMGLAVWEGIVAGVTWVWAAAMAAVDAAMDANPIIAVTVAVIAAGAAILYAYNHSVKFRAAVQALATVIKFAFVTAISIMLAAIAGLMRVWGYMLLALSHIPTFGWAKGAANAMFGAADAADRLRNKIDALHSKSITVNTTFNVTTIRSLIDHHYSDKPGGSGGKFNPNPGYAMGGTTPAFRDFVVGENGPEMMRLPVPAKVYNSGQVKSLVHDRRQLDANAGGTMTSGSSDDGVPLQVHLHIEGRTIVQSVRAYKLNTGNRPTGIG